MRYLCIASSMAAALVTMTAAPALADKAPWCAFLGGGRDGGGTECLYYSYPQCMATVSGLGGYCFENPWLTQAARESRGGNRRPY